MLVQPTRADQTESIVETCRALKFKPAPENSPIVFLLFKQGVESALLAADEPYTAWQTHGEPDEIAYEGLTTPSLERLVRALRARARVGLRLARLRRLLRGGLRLLRPLLHRRQQAATLPASDRCF